MTTTKSKFETKNHFIVGSTRDSSKGGSKGSSKGSSKNFRPSSIYNPDYSVLYPGIEISPAIREALEKSDRKMEYMEIDLKRSQNMRDAKGITIRDEQGQPVKSLSRETSYEAMIESGSSFHGAAASAEDEFFVEHMAETDELYRCFGLLEADEQELINALFFEGMTQNEYGLLANSTQQQVSRELKKILAKLRGLWEL